MTKKKADKIVERMTLGQLPSRAELYENPVKDICISPDDYRGSIWWDVRQPVMDFFIKLFSGYLWECKYGHMIAKHDERREVERILNHLVRLKTMEYGLKDEDGKVVQEPEWWPTADEECDLLFVDIARVLPSMWD